MDGFSVGDIQLPADFEQQIAAQLAANGYNFAVQPGAQTAAAPQTAATNFAVQPGVSDINYGAPDQTGVASTFAVQPGAEGLRDPNPPTSGVASTLAAKSDADIGNENEFWRRKAEQDRKLQQSMTATGGPALLPDYDPTSPRYNPALAAKPPLDTSGFSVFGNTGIRYGIGPNGQAYFNGDPISAEDYALLVKNSAPNPAFSAKDDTSGVKVNLQASGSPNTPTVSATPSAPFDYAALGAEPQLQTGPLQLSSGRSFTPETPYYTAYTNSGDAAGAVYAGEGQKVRLVDPRTGDVVFEGTGPEGAKQAVALANAASRTDGRKAAWQIQGDFGDQGWKAMAEDKVDPKHNLLGKLADVLLPIAGIALALTPGGQALLAPLISAGGSAGLSAGAVSAGVGSAAGSALSSAAQGRSLANTLLRAGFSGLTAGAVQQFAPGLGDKLGNVFSKTATNVAPTITTSTLPAALPSVAGMTGQQVVDAIRGGLLEEVVVQGTRQLIPTAAGIAAGLSGALSSAVGAPSATGAGTNASATAPGVPATPPANTVSEVVVTGALKQNPALTLLDLERMFPQASVEMLTRALLDSKAPAGGNTATETKPPADDKNAVTVEELKVEAALKNNPALSLDRLKELFPLVSEQFLTDAITKQLVDTQAKRDADLKNSAPKTLLDVVKTGDPKQIGDWIAANPLQAATLGITVAGALGGGGGGSGGGGGTYGIPTGAGSPGTRGSLSPIYSAGLPAPSSNFAVRQPRDMAGVDWKRYGMGPERSFFTNVPQNASDRLAVAPASGGPSAAATGPSASAYPAFAVVQNRLAMDSGRGPAPEGKRYIQRDDGVILLVDDSPEATYKGRSGATKKVRDLSVYQGGFTSKPISDFAAANTPEVIANLRSVGGLPMRRGGGVPAFAVQGDGDGREDAIPAKLSDGEYVIDAETVALLGNGSSKAGAAKLDRFRVNVRKHKGRELAKGKFSADAKRPEAYLAGGRT